MYSIGIFILCLGISVGHAEIIEETHTFSRRITDHLMLAPVGSIGIPCTANDIIQQNPDSLCGTCYGTHCQWEIFDVNDTIIRQEQEILDIIIYLFRHGIFIDNFVDNDDDDDEDMNSFLKLYFQKMVESGDIENYRMIVEELKRDEIDIADITFQILEEVDKQRVEIEKDLSLIRNSISPMIAECLMWKEMYYDNEHFDDTSPIVPPKITDIRAVVYEEKKGQMTYCVHSETGEGAVRFDLSYATVIGATILFINEMWWIVSYANK